MSIQEHKAVATRFCELLSAGDIQGTLDLMTDDVDYWILGRRDVVPSSGPHTKAQMKRIFEAMYERMTSGMKFTAKSMIAEGDELALEAESYAELKNGRVYNNQYHIRMKFRDGKIAEAREYLDTQHVLAVWFA
jgi:ketosteroid isomerase-like protein